MKHSSAKLHSLFFENSDTLCFVLDKDGFFVEANDATLKAFKLNKELQKVRISSIPNLSNVDNILNCIECNFEKGVVEIEFEDLNNKIVPFEVYAKKIELEGELYIICSAHTIFTSKEVENKILSTVIETEEKERSRFAKDLHDGLGPLLSTIKLYAYELNADDIDSDEQREYIQYIIELLDESVRNTREISNNLTPQILSNYGLTKSIESFINKINATNRLEIKFRYHNVPETLNKSIELTLFRIVIELINNTIKHAYAKTVNLDLFTNGSQLFLYYKDDGIGFDFEKALTKGSSGIGLTNIINRTRALSGDFFFNRTVEKGIDIRFSLDIT